MISLRYFSFLPEPVNVSTLGYLMFAAVGQMSFLALVAGIISLPIIFVHSLNLRGILYASIISFSFCVLLVDTIVFAQYRFHIDSVVLKLVMSGDVVNFSLITWLVAISAFVALFLLVFKSTVWINRRSLQARKKWVRSFSMIVLTCIVLTHSVHIWASAYGFTPITITSRYLPLFKPATANRFMQKWGFVDAEFQSRKKMVEFKPVSDVNYPLQPLQESNVDQPVNIMLIVIDSWRADSFTNDVTPVISKLSENGVVFDNHFSTGNSTRAGIFGLFYALPAQYWHPFLASRQSPVLMQRLQSLNYELGIFASAKLTQPEFDKTVFADLDALRIRSEGKTPSVRDRNLTDDWIHWYTKDRNPDLPAFSFLFYDAPHGYDFPKWYPHTFEPMLDGMNYLELNNDFDPEPLFNRYRTSVHYTDSLVGEVLDVLKQQNSLENTLLIVTGDHGQEFNDNKQGFWGHNSNFTDAQVKVPLVLTGPDTQKAGNWSESNYSTTHEDIAPTILANYLGLMNPPEDYSTGRNIFAEPVSQSWRMAANYSGYAIIQSESILEIRPGGQYNLYDMNNKLLPDAEINPATIKQAFQVLSRFSH